jgi:hypothetical protein
MNRIAIVIVAFAAAACGASGTRPRSVAELADEPLVLQGLVERCAADPKAAAHDPECLNARLAFDRLGAAADREHDPEHDAEFARERELRRQNEERARRGAAPPAFDPYSAPVTADSQSATAISR